MITLPNYVLGIRRKEEIWHVPQLDGPYNCSGRRDWDEPHTLEAWTSAIAADVYRSGIIVSKRMDIIFGHNVKDGKGASFLDDLRLSAQHIWHKEGKQAKPALLPMFFGACP